MYVFNYSQESMLLASKYRVTYEWLMRTLMLIVNVPFAYLSVFLVEEIVLEWWLHCHVVIISSIWIV